MHNWEEWGKSLHGRFGITIGDCPTIAPDSRMISFHDEKKVEQVDSLEYVVLDSRCQWLSNVDYLLTQISSRIKHHGFIVLYQDKESPTAHSLIDKILITAGVELLSEVAVVTGRCYVFRLARPQSLLVTTARPLRYRIIDSLLEIFPISSFRRGIRLAWRWVH